jgi:chromosome segregation ATPase
MLEQEQMEQTLQGIGAFQDELERTLSQVEDQVDQLFAHQSHLAPADADLERERAYDTAKAIDIRLDDVMASLQATCEHLSAANQRAFSGETGQVLQILNSHQDSLAELEGAAQKLELDCKGVTEMLTSSRR